MNFPKLPVLLTASISTRGMKGACFSDEERENMYLCTLTFYLNKMSGQQFVFAENSGWDLVNFKSKLWHSCKYPWLIFVV